MDIRSDILTRFEPIRNLKKIRKDTVFVEHFVRVICGTDSKGRAGSDGNKINKGRKRRHFWLLKYFPNNRTLATGKDSMKSWKC